MPPAPKPKLQGGGEKIYSSENLLNFGLGGGAAVCPIRLTSVLNMFAYQVYLEGVVDVKVLNFGMGVGRLSVASALNILPIKFI